MKVHVVLRLDRLWPKNVLQELDSATEAIKVEPVDQIDLFGDNGHFLAGHDRDLLELFD